MQAKGFFASLFDYSFSSFITSRIVKVLYVLMTIFVALWTLAFVLFAFKVSSTFGLIALLILGPVFFVLAMTWARVGLELIIVFFRIHEDVAEIKERADGTNPSPVVPMPPSPETKVDPAVTVRTAEPSSDAAPVVASSPIPEAAPAPQEATRFCENCGAERRPGKSFCSACGVSFA